MTPSSARLIVAAVLLCLLSRDAHAQPAGARSHAFRGRVVSVNPAAGTLSVANENIQGWMAPMTMGYKTDPVEILKTLTVGETITATVYDGDFTTLYGIKVVPGSTSAELPDIVYACPTPTEASYAADKPGTCPISGAALVATRLVTAYSCLKNEVVTREQPGTCPTDRSELVPITVALYFTCGNEPAVRELNPGTCSDGTARVKTFVRRPHGDHNPRHGGGFVFMAVDQWHHLEGIVVRPGTFRLYLYDDMARPLAASNLSGRVALADGNGQEVGPSVPLLFGQSPDHSTLDARVLSPAFPLNLKVFIRFKPNDREQVFDFTFKDYSKEQ
jgi:hypothetical protein